MDIKTIMGLCDHTDLSPTATEEEILALCHEADENHMASVCVLPHYVPLCAESLQNSDTAVCTVVGFPLGANVSAVKALEARAAYEEGAEEVDMVINLGAAKNGDWETVLSDIIAVREAVPDAVLKVIVETCYLNREEKLLAAACVDASGADFIKTSTGLGPAGAKVEDIRLFRAALNPEVRIKAAGGIRSFSFAKELIEAGADRIGESSLLKNLKNEGYV